ncbi:TetR/AcrR family transcriptional regulator [Subtercola lobariae]|uniref:HTH tetR-type domain-containing protein n=1 Tax=Subtercola lobariae TaxID=1588641 RepID=A0A917B958_9MICO|nr:TetR/AcrR family transcriptional regulator [Subtercola lobariae]GGF30873.1 hypothetical protein GCM10011399_25160 [Subtercola lobariae]
MEKSETEPLRRRNARGQGQLLRDQLIEAMARLLSTVERPETITLRQVAREVGVAPASIYGHFPNLGALIGHVLRLRYDELTQQVNASAEGAGSAVADLTARCHAYVKWGHEHPGDYATLFGNRMPTDLIPLSTHGAGEKLLESVVSSLARARAEQGWHIAEQQSWRAGLLLWTGLHGLVTLYNGHGAIDWPDLDDLTDEVIRLHVNRP